MGHGKETPRQKMIGMMYLFLTAMLALNVSKDVLQAFTLVNNGLTQTNINFSKKNDVVYTEFNKAFVLNPDKTKEWKDKADKVKQLSDALFNKIDEYKQMIVKKADGPTFDMKNIQSKDNLDIPAQLMIMEGNGKRALELKKMFGDFREYVTKIIDPKQKELISSIEKTLDTEDPPTPPDHKGEHLTWEIENFEHIPLVGVITLMTKMQSDCKNAESDAITYLLGQIGKNDFKFNKIEAIVSTKSNYVLKNAKFEAEVFIAASDSTQVPEILVGGSKLQLKNGKGIYSGATSSVGPKKWGGVINLKAPDGTTKAYKFDSEYQVGEPSLVVSPTKMNVFYVGVDNPVDVSVNGVPSEKVFPSIDGGGSISKASSGYIVKVKNPGKVKISATAEIDGKKISMGEREFRVKIVPTPIAKCGGKIGGTIKKNDLLAQQGIKAELENFDFDLKFDIVSFIVSANLKGYNEEARGAGFKFSAEQLNLMRKVETGKKLYIESIKAKGPDGSVRDLPSIVFKID